MRDVGSVDFIPAIEGSCSKSRRYSIGARTIAQDAWGKSGANAPSGTDGGTKPILDMLESESSRFAHMDRSLRRPVRVNIRDSNTPGKEERHWNALLFVALGQDVETVETVVKARKRARRTGLLTTERTSRARSHGPLLPSGQEQPYAREAGSSTGPAFDLPQRRIGHD